MSSHRYWVSALVFAGATSAAVACGPDFPTQLLDDRARTLKAYPANTFAYEASHLTASPGARIKPVESQTTWYDPDQAATERVSLLTAAEAEGLTGEQAKTVALMRAAASGDATYSLGGTLPAAVRTYSAGAVDFHVGDWGAAGARFQAVLNLPEADRRLRAVWAAYMMGEVALRTNQPAAASAAFARARQLAADGLPDPLGLAAASLGEEAKFHLDAAKDSAAKIQSDPAARDRYIRELAAAVQLYAQQAATGSNSGVQSLRIVCQMLFADPGQLAAAVTDPTTQRLLVAYALARIDNVMSPPDPSSDYNYHYLGDQGQPLNPILPALIAAILRGGDQRPEGADRLAALAYRCGQYELAEKMAALSSGPLSDWVRAKIAVQKGDLKTAAALYSSALTAVRRKPAGAPIEDQNATLLTGESGVLALARGDYVAAMDNLFATGGQYWGDVAYIAERVLTADELKTFVDTHVPAASPSAQPKDAEPEAWRPDPVTNLRKLLARRLVREGRYQEALGYFPAQRVVEVVDGKEVEAYPGDTMPKKLVSDPTVKRVADYAAALHEGESGWFRVSRARALYRAATIARESGMEIMGYEAAPDYAVEDGAFDFGYGRQTLTGPLVTDGEKQRFAASTAKPDKRFHYRYIAVNEATRAADLLPQRSQAFAAVLCNGSSWLIDRDPPVAHALYARYLKEGAYVPWATHFARACPEPNFDSAATLQWRMAWWDTRHFAGRNRWPLIAAFAVLILVAGGVVLRRRKAAH